MKPQYTNADLEAYLDESLSSARLASVEAALRDEPELVDQLATIAGRRDAGVHSLGAIWRRQRLSCPSREQLGSFLLGVLDPDHADYLQFHLDEVGCRYCNASVEDLRKQHAAASTQESESRRSKYFQSSAGYLSPED
ncbi:MAG: hypothetical protein GXP24_01445 [Planctomycetes bacterium]|nr:hypothetical protein [Planctomycetota bacterium]